MDPHFEHATLKGETCTSECELGRGVETRRKAECSKKHSFKCVIRFVSPFPLHSDIFSLFCRSQCPDGVRRQCDRCLAPSVAASSADAGAAVSALPGVVRRLCRPRKSRHAGEDEKRGTLILLSVTDTNKDHFTFVIPDGSLSNDLMVLLGQILPIMSSFNV